MGPHLTFKQYRRIDLAIFAAILALTEFLIVRAAKSWFPDQLYTVSVTAAVTAIVLMRWGPFAGIHAALGGLVYAWTSDGNLQQFVIYVVGNVLSMAAILLFKAFGKEKIRKSFLLTLLFALSGLLDTGLRLPHRFLLGFLLKLGDGLLQRSHEISAGLVRLLFKVLLDIFALLMGLCHIHAVQLMI